jgi:citrate lyase subunit beta/citryl-CoA lyase
MKIRSWLFVPGDSERKLAKIAGCGADIAVIDLEDAVAPAAKSAARDRVAEFLRTPRESSGPAVWVRINPIDGDYAPADLDAIVPAGPDGIMLPKPRGVVDVVALDTELRDREGGNDLPVSATVTETSLSVARLDDYVDHPPRLVAMSWGAEDLATELGASGNRDADGQLRDVFRHVRARFRLAAAAAGLPAIDTLWPNFRDHDGLAAYADAARADGFAGMLAIHPDQVPVINAAFTPTVEEISHARRVVAAFAAHAGAGVVGLDDQMLDRPHLLHARRVLEFLAED